MPCNRFIKHDCCDDGVESGSEKSTGAGEKRGEGSSKQLSMVWEEEKRFLLGQHHVGAL